MSETCPQASFALLRALDALQLFDNRLTGTLPRGLKAASIFCFYLIKHT